MPCSIEIWMAGAPGCLTPPVLLASASVDHKVGGVLKSLWGDYYLLGAQYSDEWIFAKPTFSAHWVNTTLQFSIMKWLFMWKIIYILPGTSRGWSKPDWSRLLSPGRRRKISGQQKQCSRNSSQTASKSSSSPCSGFVFLSQVFSNWFKVGGKLG